MTSRIVLVLALALGSNAFGPTIPECPSEQTRECLYDTGEPAEACGGVCTEAGAPCSLNLGVGFEGTCFATETDDAEGDVFICGCCEAGEGYEDASGNALPLCFETPPSGPENLSRPTPRSNYTKPS